MKWNGNDIETYLKEKQFIDTAVVPLLPIAIGSEMKTSSFTR